MISENKTISTNDGYTPLLLYHCLYSQVGCKLSQMEHSHVFDVLLSCYMLNTNILSLHYFCFHSHFFWTFHCSLLHHLSHLEYRHTNLMFSSFVYTKFLYAEYCCIFPWFIIVHFVIFCFEHYGWVQ